eukprot:TRINITY_DN5843_c0_g1_i1.p1 TRINITY_DN5843_c0_g1~~TRINITY_DN5843_c0_g1_i1.p1  ORF type:complete len:747 (+),score=119.69 TRINITY_DN5843_c0_g1_i1:193-2241(+)
MVTSITLADSGAEPKAQLSGVVANSVSNADAVPSQVPGVPSVEDLATVDARLSESCSGAPRRGRRGASRAAEGRRVVDVASSDDDGEEAVVVSSRGGVRHMQQANLVGAPRRPSLGVPRAALSSRRALGVAGVVALRRPSGGVRPLSPAEAFPVLPPSFAKGASPRQRPSLARRTSPQELWQPSREIISVDLWETGDNIATRRRRARIANKAVVALDDAGPEIVSVEGTCVVTPPPLRKRRVANPVPTESAGAADGDVATASTAQDGEFSTAEPEEMAWAKGYWAPPTPPPSPPPPSPPRSPRVAFSSLTELCGDSATNAVTFQSNSTGNGTICPAVQTTGSKPVDSSQDASRRLPFNDIVDSRRVSSSVDRQLAAPVCENPERLPELDRRHTLPDKTQACRTAAASSIRGHRRRQGGAVSSEDDTPLSSICDRRNNAAASTRSPLSDTAFAVAAATWENRRALLPEGGRTLPTVPPVGSQQASVSEPSRPAVIGEMLAAQKRTPTPTPPWTPSPWKISRTQDPSSSSDDEKPLAALGSSTPSAKLRRLTEAPAVRILASSLSQKTSDKLATRPSDEDAKSEVHPSGKKVVPSSSRITPVCAPGSGDVEDAFDEGADVEVTDLLWCRAVPSQVPDVPSVEAREAVLSAEDTTTLSDAQAGPHFERDFCEWLRSDVGVGIAAA